MSVVNLLNKVSPPVLAGILKKMDLKFSDIKDVLFTFADFGGPAGTTITTANRFTHEVLGYHINVDEAQCNRYGGMVGTLVHELQHLKQSLDGRHAPDPDDDSFARWDGKRFPTEDSIRRNSWRWGLTDDAAFAMYRNLPWETDADDVSKRVIDELVAEGILKLTPGKGQT